MNEEPQKEKQVIRPEDIGRLEDILPELEFFYTRCQVCGLKITTADEQAIGMCNRCSSESLNPTLT